MNEAYYILIFLMMILIPLFVLTSIVIHLGKTCETEEGKTAPQLLFEGKCT